MPDIWGWASVAAKIATYAGVFGSFGTVLAVIALGLSMPRARVLCFAVLGFVATLAGFGLRGAMLTGDLGGMTDPEMLGLLWSTSVGTAVGLRLAGLVMLVVGVFLGRPGVLLSVASGVVAVWSFVAIGHVPDQDNVLLKIALLLHLLVVSLWMGALSPLRQLALDPANLPRAAAAADHFGRIALVLVPVLIIAGLVMGNALVGSLAALTQSPYGLTLLAKIFLVAGLLALAAANKTRFVPGMRAGNVAAARSLARSISFEWAAFIAIFATTAILTTVLTLPQ